MSQAYGTCVDGHIWPTAEQSQCRHVCSLKFTDVSQGRLEARTFEFELHQHSYIHLMEDVNCTMASEEEITNLIHVHVHIYRVWRTFKASQPKGSIMSSLLNTAPTEKYGVPQKAHGSPLSPTTALIIPSQNGLASSTHTVTLTTLCF